MVLNATQVEQETPLIGWLAQDEKISIYENHYMQLYIMIIVTT